MQCWEANVRQSIASIASGHVTSAAHDEYIVHTFGGAILAYTAGPTPLATLPAAAAADDKPDTLAAKQRELDAAKQELQALDAELQVRITIRLLLPGGCLPATAVQGLRVV